MVRRVRTTTVAAIVMNVVMAAIFVMMRQNDTGVPVVVSNSHSVEVGKFVKFGRHIYSSPWILTKEFQS